MNSRFSSSSQSRVKFIIPENPLICFFATSC